MVELSGAANYLKHIKRSIPTLVIASTCFSMIYFDYTHTQKWKRDVKLQSELIAKSKA